MINIRILTLFGLLTITATLFITIRIYVDQSSNQHLVGSLETDIIRLVQDKTVLVNENDDLKTSVANITRERDEAYEYISNMYEQNDRKLLVMRGGMNP